MDKKYLKAITKRQKNGSLLAIASTENKDRVGDSLKAEDWDFKHFQNNPVLQAGHDYRPQYTIGIAENLKVENGQVTFTPKFHNITKLAQEISKMYEEGFLTAWSVGFIPKESNVEIKKNQLLEVSAVAVPANPYALTSLKSCKKELESVDNDVIENIKEWVTKEYDELTEQPVEEPVVEAPEEGVDEKIWDDSETEVRYRVKNPELFEQDSFRTIAIKEDKPSINAVIGKLIGEESTTIQSLVFSKDEGRTLEDAKTWVEEHPDIKAIGEEDVPLPDETVPEDMPMDKPAEDAEESESDKPEMMKMQTGETNGHTHEAEFGKESGNGKTNEVEMHYHDIENFIVKEAGEVAHTHSLDVQPEEGNEDEEVVIEETGLREFKYKERWNKSLSKSFDIENAPSITNSPMFKIYTKYLECSVKDVFVNSTFVPSPMIGNYLNAVKNILSGYNLKGTRGYDLWSGNEIPPLSEVIKLNSSSSDDFLVQGTQYYENEGKGFVVQYQPVWGGMSVDILTSRNDKDFNKNIKKLIEDYAEKNNKLKGEMFALSGEFLVKTDERFDDIVLDAVVKKSIVNTSSQMVKKGIEFASRGMIFMGPPGTGKTKTCRAIMNSSDSTFIWVSSKDLRAYGAVECISLAYSLARKIAPAIILFEDIDTWIKDYVIDALKTELDGLNSTKAILTILTSNNPENLPDSLIDRPGRFHEVLEFGLPNKALRSEMIVKFIGDSIDSVDTDNLNKVIDDTEGMSGAHIKELVEYAKVISEEEAVSLDVALVKSLDKIKKQRELISTIQSKAFNLKLKEGRVLSTKNIEVINQAITAQKNSVQVLEKLLEESSAMNDASKAQKPFNKNESLAKGRTEPQKRMEQKTIGQMETSDQIVLRVLQKIAGQSCYALNKLNRKI